MNIYRGPPSVYRTLVHLTLVRPIRSGDSREASSGGGECGSSGALCRLSPAEFVEDALKSHLSTRDRHGAQRLARDANRPWVTAVLRDLGQ